MDTHLFRRYVSVRPKYHHKKASSSCRIVIDRAVGFPSKDGPGDYPVVMEVMAGSVSKDKLQPKSLCRLTTGAPVPDGADAVIKVRLHSLLFF